MSYFPPDEGPGPAPPPRKSRLGRYLTYVLFAWMGLLVLFLLAQSSEEPTADPGPAKGPVMAKAPPPRGYDPVRDVHDSVQAAKEIDTMLTRSGAEKILKFSDVSTKDGHLIVHFKEVYNLLGTDDKALLERQILTYWRQTKYVAVQGWSPTVEFIEHTENSSHSRTRTP